MLRVCIDTNVWISGFIFSGIPSKILDFALKKRVQLVLSSFILDEVQRNLIQKFEVAPKTAKALIYRLAQIADVYEPNGSVHVIADMHADNLVLETAVIGKARYLVTGDRKHLLPLKVFRNVKIIEPATFWPIIDRS